MPASTDADIVAMPRIADATLAATFHWPASPEERLYRDCPTAFWLDPAGDDALPPVDGPTPALLDPDVPPSALPAARADGVGTAIFLGTGVAGPVFIAALSLVVEGAGSPLLRTATGLAFGLASSPLSIPFGGLAAALPVIFGVSVLAYLGCDHPLARRHALWSATGVGMGLLIAALFDAGVATIPLVLTSAVCAAVARSTVSWIHSEPA